MEEDFFSESSIFLYNQETNSSITFSDNEENNDISMYFNDHEETNLDNNISKTIDNNKKSDSQCEISEEQANTEPRDTPTNLDEKINDEIPLKNTEANSRIIHKRPASNPPEEIEHILKKRKGRKNTKNNSTSSQILPVKIPLNIDQKSTANHKSPASSDNNKSAFPQEIYDLEEKLKIEFPDEILIEEYNPDFRAALDSLFRKFDKNQSLTIKYILIKSKIEFKGSANTLNKKLKEIKDFFIKIIQEKWINNIKIGILFERSDKKILILNINFENPNTISFFFIHEKSYFKNSFNHVNEILKENSLTSIIKDIQINFRTICVDISNSEKEKTLIKIQIENILYFFKEQTTDKNKVKKIPTDNSTEESKYHYYLEIKNKSDKEEKEKEIFINNLIQESHNNDSNNLKPKALGYSQISNILNINQKCHTQNNFVIEQKSHEYENYQKYEEEKKTRSTQYTEDYQTNNISEDTVSKFFYSEREISNEFSNQAFVKITNHSPYIDKDELLTAITNRLTLFPIKYFLFRFSIEDAIISSQMCSIITKSLKSFLIDIDNKPEMPKDIKVGIYFSVKRTGGTGSFNPITLTLRLKDSKITYSIYYPLNLNSHKNEIINAIEEKRPSSSIKTEENKLKIINLPNENQKIKQLELLAKFFKISQTSNSKKSSSKKQSRISNRK